MPNDDCSITVQGLSELEAKLHALPDEMVRKIFGKALRDAGNVMKTEVVNRAPVRTDDSGPNTNALPPGALKASIGARVTLKPETGSGSVTVKPSTKASHVARWVEFGHRLVSHKPGKKVIGAVPAHPFMRPAFDAAKQATVDAFTATLSNSLSELDGSKQ